MTSLARDPLAELDETFSDVALDLGMTGFGVAAGVVVNSLVQGMLAPDTAPTGRLAITAAVAVGGGWIGYQASRQFALGWSGSLLALALLAWVSGPSGLTLAEHEVIDAEAA
jgi:hypothetical protein